MEIVMRRGMLLAPMLAAGCGAATPSNNGTPSGNNTPAGTLPGTATTSGAVVSVELRGNESLNFADGARIRIDRFVVNFGGVALLRDLADPQSSRVDLPGRELPIIGGPGESVMDRFIIGKEKFEGGNFRGLRVELAPALLAPTDAPGTVPVTLSMHGTFSMPVIAESPKAGHAKISPNPAPIEPAPGQSSQGISATYQINFSFESRRSQNVLVGLGENFAAGRSIVVVFPTQSWFNETIRDYFRGEATTRIRLGMSGEETLRLAGEGIRAESPLALEIGELLETNVLDSIGVELR